MKFILILMLVFSVTAPAFATITDLIPIADSGISEYYPDDNDGDFYSLEWGSYGGKGSRSLIEYDCSSLAGETVSDAAIVFTLYGFHPTGTASMRARKVEADWGEMTATWNNQPSYDTTSAGLMLDFPDGFGSPGPIILALTDEAIPIIQDWIDDPATNFGFILLKEPEYSDERRCYPYSREDSSATCVWLRLEHGVSGIESASLGSIKAVFK